jgi:hypothetical protein
MQTLTSPTPILPELSTPSCEQVVPGNVTADERDGKIGSGGKAPDPLQGGAGADDRESEKETGNEGTGT